MAKIYFTLTGTKYYHGNEFLKPGMKLKLKKEPAVHVKAPMIEEAPVSIECRVTEVKINLLFTQKILQKEQALRFQSF